MSATWTAPSASAGSWAGSPPSAWPAHAGSPPASRSGVLAWGVGVALLGVTTTTVVALVLLAGVGAGNTVVDVAAVTLLQRSADDAVLGRVFGVLETVLLSALGLGSILAPLAIHALGIRAALISTGLVLPVVVVAFSRAAASPSTGPIPRSPSGRRCSAPTRSSSPLAEGTLEQLARALEPVAVVAGADVIRQGDHGDRVYVVASGELAGRRRRAGRAAHSAAGDVFGEIALLRDVPRTATVRAATAAELLTLGRDEFLAGGHRAPDERRRGRPGRRDPARRAPAGRRQGLSEESTEQSMGGRRPPPTVGRRPTHERRHR